MSPTTTHAKPLSGRGYCAPMHADIGLPSGVVTFVFTDVEGSTRLFRDLGDRYPPMLEEHRAMLRATWAAHSGVEVTTEGDSFFVAFDDPTRAVLASVAAVERIDNHEWPTTARFRIRAGMHTGVAYPRDGGYIAYPVHQAARIGSVGHGGQVVVSPATAELVGDLGRIHLHELGSYRVRDFDDPIRLYQAESGATATPHPALRTQADVLHNLRGDTARLIGREQDLAGVETQMRETRLLSLVGPGGVGKTALAQAVGQRAVDGHVDGCWFVDLSACDDRATIRGAIADVLGVTSDELNGALGDKQQLLILDNCEQAAGDVADVVTDLIASSSETRFLITSREPLSIATERLWRLGPLDGPTSAVDLFVKRAKSVAADFDGDAHHEAIAQICERLDGLPLAIELAAARVTAMSPAELFESLSDMHSVLRSRRRDLDARHRTATGSVDWSYRLLDESERLVLRHLAVFRDDFDIESAAAAAAGSGLSRIDVADIVWSLADKSLVMVLAVSGGTRYRLLETTRVYARQALTTAGERAVAEVSLGRRYVARFDPTTAHDADNAAQLFDEQSNIRALALDLAAHTPGLGQQLAWALGVHYRRSEPARGLAELEPLIAVLDVEGEGVVGMHAIRAQLHLDLGDVESATLSIESAERFLDPDGPMPVGAGWLANARAIVALISGDISAGQQLAEEGIAGSNDLAQLSLINTVAAAKLELGDLEGAVGHFGEILAKARAMPHPTFEATALGNVAEVELRLGNLVTSARHTREALRLFSELGMTAPIGFGLIGVARLLAARAMWNEAVMIHRAAESILDETGQMLYPTDRRLSDELLQDATTALGEDRFDTVAERGRELGLAPANELAISLLDAYVETAHTT